MDIKEKIKGLSGEELHKVLLEHRREETIKLIMRQTNYSKEKTEEKLQFWKGNYINVIREYMNPDFQKSNKKEKKYQSTNQRIIGEIRNFMDQGAKLAEKRRIRQLLLQRKIEKQKMENKKMENTKMENKKMENKKIN